MVQIIESNRPASFSEKLLGGVQGGIDKGIDQFSKHIQGQELKKKMMAENEQIKNLTGKDISGIQDPKIRQQIVQDLMKGDKKDPRMGQLQTGLSTVQKMRNIGKRNNLGKTLTRGVFGGEQAKDRAEYEQLGKSLISLASTIPIRNQLEFQTLSEKLYDPSLRDSEREGILDAMEHIITSELNQQGGMNQSQSMPQQQQQQQQEKRPLSFFKRKR